MRSTSKILAALLLAAAMLGAPPGPAPAEGPEPMTLLSINVGKADCLLLMYEDLVYMIDTGAWESWGAVSAALKVNGIDRLDAVIVTHTDRDHAGGAMALASSSVEVGAWYSSAYFCEVKEKKHPVKLAAELRGEEVRWLKAGDSLPFGSGSLTVLGPTKPFEDKENNNSLVLLAEAAGASILLAGDMEKPEEDLLLSAGVLRPVTVLKVGHHGEGDATSNAFAAAVRPKLAVISTNSVAEPDTPDKDVLRALAVVGAQVVLTEDAPGAIRVRAAQGNASAEALAWENLPLLNASVALAERTAGEDIVTVRNGGAEAADLSGWFITSERGGEIFVFPAGTVLAPGAELTVSSLSSASDGDLVWQEKSVWHKNKDDPAVLSDVYGRPVSRLE